MRVALFGQSWLGARLVEALATHTGINLVCLVAGSPKAEDAARKMASLYGIVTYASQEGLLLADRPFDIGVCAHYFEKISPFILRAAPKGVIGYHPSLLPLYRGRNSVVDTIEAGDSVAGGTIYKLDDGMDTGPILAQASCEVLPGEDAAGLWRRALAPLGERLLLSMLELYASGYDPAEFRQEVA